MDPHTLIHAVAVSEDSIRKLDRNVLLYWSGNPFSPCASYGHDKESGFEINRDNSLWHHESLSDARQLVFGRELEGSKDGSRYEILQEYAHLAGIHWRPERHAYCRFDELGDWEHVVSVTRDDISEYRSRDIQEAAIGAVSS